MCDVAAMIRIDAVWLAVEPIDVRAGADRLLAQRGSFFGAARAHHGTCSPTSSTRIKLHVHDGFGVWCAARRLNVGGFAWPRRADALSSPLAVTREQFDALVLGLPWQRLDQLKLITRMWLG